VEHVQCRRVRPLEIIGEEEQWSSRSERPPQARNRFKEAGRGKCLDNGRRRQAGVTLAQFGQQLAQFGQPDIAQELVEILPLF
jgi:hypothetical protein